MTGELILLGIVAIWGASFTIVKDVLESWPPFALMSVRFLLATLPFLPFLKRAVSDRVLFGRGAILATLLFLGFALQVEGLRWTTPSRAAFFTAVSVPLVPAFRFLFLRLRPERGTIVALLLGSAGIWLLLGRELGAEVRFGDLLCLACAVVFAWHIIAVGAYTARHAPVDLSAVQLAVTALLSLAAMAVTREAIPPRAGGAWGSVVYLGLVGTALTVFGQAAGQRRTTVNRAAFLFALEPVAAALYAWAVAGDRLGPTEIAGGALLALAAVIADRPLRMARGRGARRVS